MSAVLMRAPGAVWIATACLLGWGSAPTRASVIAQWTFQINTPADLGNSATGPVVAGEGGVFAATSIATGAHASSATDWSTPVGNGSTESFSSNNWTTGDYYQFQTSSTGFQNISIAWDQSRSETGPVNFDLQYSTNGTTYTSYFSYTVPINPTWTSNAQNLGGVTSLNNLPNIFFRLTATSGTTNPAGTNRIDNITIQGDPLPGTSGVPEPGTWLTVGASLLSAMTLQLARSSRRPGSHRGTFAGLA